MAVIALVSVSVLPLAARGHYAHSRYIGKKMVVFILDHGIGPHHRLKDGSELYIMPPKIQTAKSILIFQSGIIETINSTESDYE